MSKIKIGSSVTATLFGGERVTGKVLSIEICKPNEKYGRSVSTCDTSKHKNGVVTLDCDHWCYFYQIKD